jgi:NADP-dependent 3-hydroxy acid dehydrogenase YdfG
MTMIGIEGKVVAITGASSGIGEATARLLVQRGAHVVVGARRADRLAALVEELRGVGSIEACTLDVTQRESVQNMVEVARSRYGRLDVMVNNAGVMPLSMFAAGRIDEWEQTLDVNVRGVLHGIHAALPVMLAQGGGQFVNVSSTAGHTVFPGCGVYCASKFAVNAISEALRQEHDDIRVTIVSPGVTDSELAETTHEPSSRAFLRDFRKVSIPALAIAEAVAFAIAQPSNVNVSELIVRPTASAA